MTDFTALLLKNGIQTLAFVFIVLLSNNINAQTITFNHTVPTDIMVCDESQSFTVEFTNNSGGSISNMSIGIDLPTGINYTSSTFSTSSNGVSLGNANNPNNFIVNVASLANSAVASFTFDASASFDAYNHQLSGGVFRNAIFVAYSSVNENSNSDPYNLLYPALSITTVDPMAPSVFVGETFPRNITIVNGGYGRTSSIVIKDIMPSDLTLDATNIGAFNPATNEITLSGDDFSAFGNGDNYLDQNEAITFTQTVTAIGCNSAQDEITAYWGCNDQSSPSNTKYPYTTVSLFPPNLSINHVPVFNTCMDGSADIQRLEITNNGTGPANDAQFIIKQEPAAVYSRIDANSITLSQNSSASNLTASATVNASAYACQGTDPKGGFTVTLPAIQPGETVILEWDSYTCRPEVCTQVELIGWDYEYEYTDMCFSNVYSGEAIGQPEKEKNFSLFNENPSDLVDEETGLYNFILTGATFNLPQGTNPYFQVEFDIPLGLIWSGNNSDLTYVSGTNQWSPSSINFDAGSRKLTAQYQLPVPFALIRSEFKLNLTADCDALVSGNTVTVGMQLFYIMDSSCANPFKMPMTCYVTPITQLHCPGNCDHGLAFNDFEVIRTSLGSPDNNIDGLPDGGTAFDASKIKLNRVMASDTFNTIFYGTVKTSASFPSWEYGYATSAMPYGDKMEILSAQVDIFDASTNTTITCNNLPFTQTLNGTTRNATFDYSIPSLIANGCSGLTGFILEEADKITITATYHVTGNIGGSVEQVTIDNAFWLSPNANGTKYQCNDWNGNFTLIGYYFTTWNTEQYYATDCSKIVSQNYYMSIGNCCSNYSGGDLFPYEYRNWGNIEGLRVEIPEGYTVGAMSMNQQRTKHTNAAITESVSTIVPSSVAGQEYTFDLEQYYIQNGGVLNLSDDGFNGTVALELIPNCNVNPASNLPIKWHYTFREAVNISGDVTPEYTRAADYIQYKKANLNISTPLQTQEGISSTVSWDINIKNNTGTHAPNSWAFIYSADGNLNILEVKDKNTSQTLTPVNGFYQLSTTNAGATRQLQIIADYNSCATGELKVITGYSCDGYPSNLNDFNCPSKDFSLYMAPQPSELQVKTIITTNAVDPCDDRIGIEFELLSSKLATVNDITIEINVPNSNSISIESGSTEILYPLNGAYTSANDPTQSGTTYTISGADISSEIASNGLVGVTDITKNMARVKFNLLLEPNFKSGDIVNFSIKSKRVCGDALPTLSLAFDPGAVFGRKTGVGLGDANDSWAMAWADYNRDGFVDLFVTSYKDNEVNILYKNNGNGTFSKDLKEPFLSDKASSLAATWGDYDNDGDLDLFVANNIGHKNFLYRNNGDGTFVKIQNDPLVDDNGYSHGAAWADYDNDGYMDMFITEYFSTKFNKLYRNNGDGTFSKNTSAAPTLEASNSVSAAWGDYNNDGLIDLFVANTENANNTLYTNNGGGNFTKTDMNDGGYTVGASWGDYDNDGDLDLFATNAAGQNNFFYRNINGNLVRTNLSPITTDGGNSHGSSWADFDNDGDLDLFVANDKGENNFLYTNNNGNFTKVTNQITTDGGFSFGSAWADYDNDLDVDLFIANQGGRENFIYENERGKCNQKACFNLSGTNSNASAIGAKLYLTATIYGQTVTQMREISSQTGGGIGGQNEYKTIFGLGDANSIESLTIVWPSGYTQTVTNPTINDCNFITEENGSEVCGVAYYDANGNCIQDEDETGLSNIRIEAGDRVAVTDETGAYQFNLPTGTFNLNPTSTTGWSVSCGANQSVNIAGIGGTYCGYNFGLTASCTDPDLGVEITNTLNRVGFNNLVAITYTNIGGGEANNAVLSVDFGTGVTPIDASLPWTSLNGSIATWDISKVKIGESTTIYVTDYIELTVSVGSNLTFNASIASDETDCSSADNTFIETALAVGAVDPNDILVSPEGNINPDQELSYKIRFQNVGNREADYVRIEDVLPKGLDLSTIVVGAASHNYRFNIVGERQLVWEFENINMPDSITNEPESHGFVTFKIRPKVGLELGTEIDNSALIFFDRNEPIVTNTVTNIIGVNTANSDIKPGELFIYPNPMTIDAKTNIVGPNPMKIVNIQDIKVYDVLGRLVYQQQNIEASQFTLKKKDFSQGYYSVTATGEDQREYIGKMIVN